MNEGSLQSEDRMSSRRGGGSHSDPNPDDSEAAGLDEPANQGSSNVSDIFGRRNGSNARVFSSNAVNLDASPTSESDRILCSSAEVSRSLGENDSPVDLIKNVGMHSRTDSRT